MQHLIHFVHACQHRYTKLGLPLELQTSLSLGEYFSNLGTIKKGVKKQSIHLV